LAGFVTYTGSQIGPAAGSALASVLAGSSIVVSGITPATCIATTHRLVSQTYIFADIPIGAIAAQRGARAAAINSGARAAAVSSGQRHAAVISNRRRN
jgi:hypothetical protein